jgi:hypothetical protein
MVSFRTTFLALATAVAVSADYYVIPSSVPLATRSMLDIPVQFPQSKN